MTEKRQSAKDLVVAPVSAAALVVAPVHEPYSDILFKDDNTRLCFLCKSRTWPCDYQDLDTKHFGMTCKHEHRHAHTTCCKNKAAQRIAIHRSIEYLNEGGR